jgi:hypothetical protein
MNGAGITVKNAVRAAMHQTAAQIGQDELAPLYLAAREGPNRDIADEQVAWADLEPGAHRRDPYRRRSDRPNRPNRPSRPSRPDRPSRPSRPNWRGSSRPLAAFGAAAAILAVIGASVAAATRLEHDRRTDMTILNPAASPSAAPPRYVVEIVPPPGHLTDERLHAVVIDAQTGKIVATVDPPRPYEVFLAVTGATDDTTFVLAASRWVPMPGSSAKVTGPVKFFELTLTHRRGRTATGLRPLGLRFPARWTGRGLALSPDGKELAVAASPASQPSHTLLKVYSLVTQVTTAWTGRALIGVMPWDAKSLSWAPDDQSLAYDYDWDGRHKAVKVLDTAAGGGSLALHSRPLVTFATGLYPVSDAALTPEGTKVIAIVRGTRSGTPAHFTGVAEYSTATGQLVSTRRLPPLPNADQWRQVLWTSGSGTVAVLGIEFNPGKPHPDPVQELRGSHLTPLPTVIGVNGQDIAW